MAGSTKKKIRLFLAFDYDLEEEHINSMSKQGWQLKKGGLFHHSYIKGDQDYRYQLDFNLKVKKDYDEFNRYLDKYKEQGWEHINSTINGWHYFRKLYIPGTDEEGYSLNTDDTSLNKMLRKWNHIARTLQVVYIIYTIFSIINLAALGNTLAGLSSMLSFLAITLLQLGMLTMKGKRVRPNKKSPTRTFISYTLLGGMGISFILMLYLLFFGFYIQRIEYSTQINCNTQDFRGDFTIKKDGFYMLDIKSKSERGTLMIQISRDDKIIYNCGGSKVTVSNKRLCLKEGEYNVDVIYYLEDYKDAFSATQEQLEKLNLTGNLEETSGVEVFVGLKN